MDDTAEASPPGLSVPVARSRPIQNGFHAAGRQLALEQACSSAIALGERPPNFPSRA